MAIINAQHIRQTEDGMPVCSGELSEEGSKKKMRAEISCEIQLPFSKTA